MSSVMATNRFGLGAKRGELRAAAEDPKAWVKAQLVPIVFSRELPSTAEAVKLLADFKKQKRMAKRKKSTLPEDFQKDLFKRYLTDYFQLAIASDNSVSMRLLRFWTNHFSVAARTPNMQVLAPTLQRDVISRHCLGKFEDLLLAVTQHPAMLTYLDNVYSIGPNSAAAKKNRGLNENLAREVMELHTIGVNGGYQQTDVTELAKALTGWSINTQSPTVDGAFQYKGWAHEPGTRRFRGKKYADTGVKQATDMLKSLARDPATARFICGKLVRHFVNDDPPPAIVNACVKRWQQTDGDLRAVFITLVEHPGAWDPKHKKFKTPEEFVISSFRGLRLLKPKERLVARGLATMGHAPYKAESPEGYGDIQQDWDGSAALMSRIEWSHEITRYVRKSAVKFAQNMLGNSVSQRTLTAIERAESSQQGATLLLMSPEFQWR